MTTFNTAVAPQAPAYVSELWQIESNVGYLNFKFRTTEAAQEMLNEVKQDGDVNIANICGNTVSVHYHDRNATQSIAKAISEAYGIEVIGVGFRLV